jgi:hypothetical protein
MLALGTSILMLSTILVLLAEFFRKRGVQTNIPGDA